MKVKLSILVLFYAMIGFAQQNPSFFVKIPDSQFVLTKTHEDQGKRINTFKSSNKGLNNLIAKYQIYSTEHVFKNSKRPSLQNIYLVNCNDIKLMSDLSNSFSNLYFELHNAKVENLILPNDFGATGGFIEYQEELNYIRAPEAWNLSTSSPNIIIGISDSNVNYQHEDLNGKVNIVYGNNFPNSNGQHGSEVSSMAAADTNNGLGMSATGYDSSIYNATNNWVPGVDYLSQIDGVKVINTAWVNGFGQEMYNEVVEDRKVVVVGAAGNGIHPGSTQYVYPAAFKNVISVSSIAHETADWYDTWNNHYVTQKDNHQIQFNTDLENSHQHNDSVDIVAPGYGVLVARPQSGLSSYVRGGGTSFAAPIVSGTIALMFDVNYCLDPKEVETILKLTAVKIDTLPANLPFYGKLGAGKLDAYEAVKMSSDMAEAFGTVEVKNRILYRPWFYKLVTAPYEIKMTNNDVSAGSKLKFRARNNIEILSGDYSPGSGGYIDLSIDETLVLDCSPPPPIVLQKQMEKINNKKVEHINFQVTPSLIDKETEIINYTLSENIRINIKIYNYYGKEVYDKNEVLTKKVRLNLTELTEGIYIIKISNPEGIVLYTQKIIKK